MSRACYLLLITNLSLQWYCLSCCLHCSSIWRHHWKWMLHSEFGNLWTHSQKRNPLKATKYKRTFSISESSWLPFPQAHILPSASAVVYEQSLMAWPRVSALRRRVLGGKKSFKARFPAAEGGSAPTPQQHLLHLLVEGASSHPDRRILNSFSHAS